MRRTAAASLTGIASVPLAWLAPAAGPTTAVSRGTTGGLSATYVPEPWRVPTHPNWRIEELLLHRWTPQT